MFDTDDGMKDLLERLFVDGKRYEVVATTVGDKGRGRTNASTMGVIREGQGLLMRVFHGTDTFGNLRGLKRIGINIVTEDEIDLAARAALHGWHREEPEFEASEYENLHGFPFLREAPVLLDCSVEDWTENYGKDDYGDYHIANFKAVPQRSRVRKEDRVPLERGTSPLIEALVFSTRWHVSDGETREFLRHKVMAHIEEAKAKGKRDRATRRAIEVIEAFLDL